jgi:hypothetical protein
MRFMFETEIKDAQGDATRGAHGYSKPANGRP